MCVCACASWVSLYTIHILCVQQGGEPAKRNIALPCLLSGGENENRKWADGAGEQGKRGEWRDEQRLREKSADDWRDRKRKDGGQQAWTNDWEREARETE